MDLRLSSALAVVCFSTLLAGPGGSASAPAPATTGPAAQAAQDRAGHMDKHFTEVALIEQAVVRGDLDAVRDPARWIFEHEEVAGLAASQAPVSQVGLMRSAAKTALEASQLEAAASATGAMVTACGTCHKEVGVHPKMTTLAQPAPAAGVKPHMLEHQWAVDMMQRGLVGPSDDLWTQGAERLKRSPLASKEFPKDPKLTAEVVALESHVQAIAQKATKTPDPGGRARAYGEILATCGGCHSLHGRVWGPGLPKG